MAALYSFNALKRKVCDANVQIPVENSSKCSSHVNVSKIEKLCPVVSITIMETIRTAQLEYHDTTLSWNFFILRIAIVPPADKKALRISAKYTKWITVGLALSDSAV